MRALLLLIAVWFAGCEHGSGGPMPDGGTDVQRDCALVGGAQGARCDPGASCFIEGHATCDEEPVSGGCSCSDAGTWECFSSCPADCPSTEPPQGAACSLPITTICPYAGGFPRTECTCVDHAFDCH